MTTGGLTVASGPSGLDGGEPGARRPSGAASVPDVVRRRLTPPGGGPGGWLATAVVVFVAGTLRMTGLAHPPGMIFDEVYYARQGAAMLDHGVEWKDNAPEYVVHPPLGKWLIALGELVFGTNAVGWRIAAAVAGTLSVLILVRVARRMFGSTVLACAAGLLLALDGMHFVLSRVALLDIFLMLFVLAAFACLVADRDQRRRRALAALESGGHPAHDRLRLGLPWWRVAAAATAGCACAVKWSGVWYLLLAVALAAWWEIGLRRSAGVRRPWRTGVLSGAGWAAVVTGVAAAVYLASWTGWFVSDDGFDRHWLRAGGRAEPPGYGALVNLWQYHREALSFHTGLGTPHPYQSWPWQWLLLGRPVRLYSDFPATGCGAVRCAADILMLGTPVLWWSFPPALAALVWYGVARRDWRAGAIGLGAAAGIVPWFWYALDGRTMYAFYALPAEPFLVLAVVYVWGAVIGPPRVLDWPMSGGRLFRVVLAGLYVALVAINFAYFYPIYTGHLILYDEWWARMWLGTRWA